MMYVKCSVSQKSKYSHIIVTHDDLIVMYQSGSSPGLSVEPTQMSTQKGSVKSTPPDGGNRDTFSVGCSIVSHHLYLWENLAHLAPTFFVLFCF